MPRYRKKNNDDYGQCPDSDVEVDIADDTSLVGHPEGNEVTLERNIGIFGCISFVVGTTIGSGIFVAPKGVLVNAGSIGMALVIWVVSGVICGIGGMCYAELGSTFPRSGGDFTFLLENFGPLPAFLRVWTSIVAVRTAAATVVAITAAEYLLKPMFPACQDIPEQAVRLLAAFLICGVSALNCRSATLGAKIQIIFTISKLVGLLVIGLSGLVLLCQGEGNNALLSFASTDVTKLPLALYSGLFAYSGFQYLPQITEEVINPTRTIPIGIMASMAIVITVYLLANIAYFVVLTPEEILSSSAVAVDYGRYELGPFWWTMSIVVTLSCIGSLNGTVFTTPRMFFVAAREELLPEVFGMIHINWKTPLPSIVSMMPVMLATLLVSDIYSIINYFSFMRWTFLILSVAIIPYSRWKQPYLKRPFKLPLILPLIFIMASFFVVIVSLYSAPHDCGIGLIITLSGIPVYYIGVGWKNKPEWVKGLLTSFTHSVQKISYVVPQESKIDESAANEYEKS